MPAHPQKIMIDDENVNIYQTLQPTDNQIIHVNINPNMKILDSNRESLNSNKLQAIQ